MTAPTVTIGWEDGGNAQVTITCCNIEHDEMVGDASLNFWICPECKTIVDFIWKGMEYNIRQIGSKEDEIK